MDGHADTCNNLSIKKPFARFSMTDYFQSPVGISKEMVKRAGKALAEKTHTPEQYKIAQQWRDSHAYVLNTFQGTLRRWIGSNKNIILVQRLKRMSTIQDKLATGRAKNLSSMHDLAGCRLIFDSLDDLHEFRRRFHTTRAKHERINGDKYDYIAQPKDTGYRGIHDVYSYNVKDAPGNEWNGLKVEIQYRTKVQHAWATAVEIADALDGARIKFDIGGNPNRERLFLLISEWLARRYENSSFIDISVDDLIKEISDLDDEQGIFNRLRAMKNFSEDIPNSKNLVLEFGKSLKVTEFRSNRLAMEYRNQKEIENPDADIVFIRSDNPASTKSAFRNYFRNAYEFLSYIRRTPDL